MSTRKLERFARNFEGEYVRVSVSVFERDIDEPNLYALDMTTGGISGGRCTKADLLRVIDAWREMLSELPA